MRKISKNVLNNLTSARLSASELNMFLLICQYQSNAGIVSGVYYKDICTALNLSYKTFYNSLRVLADRKLIRIQKSSYIDYDITILGNDFSAQKYGSNNHYLSLADGLFEAKGFADLKANEKIVAMDLLDQVRSGKGTQIREKTRLVRRYMDMLSCTFRTVRGYLRSLRKFFLFKDKGSNYEITIYKQIEPRPLSQDTTDMRQEHQQEVRKVCNRYHLSYTDTELKDTAYLAIQYAEPIADMRKTNSIDAKASIFDWVAQHLGKRLRRTELNAKYIHSVLTDMLANAQQHAANGFQHEKCFAAERTNTDLTQMVIDRCLASYAK